MSLRIVRAWLARGYGRGSGASIAWDVSWLSGSDVWLTLATPSEASAINVPLPMLRAMPSVRLSSV
jgi:hypothetical protein